MLRAESKRGFREDRESTRLPAWTRGVAPGVTAEGATTKGRLCLEVVIQEGENLERALRRFKRKVQRSGLYSELRKRRFYEKPSAQRKRKREAAIRRERRRQRRNSSRR